MLRNLNRSFSGRRIAGTSHVGVLAAAIPTTGDYPALGLNDIDAGDPEDCEYRVQILTWPSSGTLVVAEDTSFTFDPPSEEFVGVLGGTQRIYKNGVAVYDEEYSFTFGDISAVSSDLVSSYGVSAQVSSDLATTYSLAAAVGANLDVTYAVLADVAADMVASYTVMSSLTEVFTDLIANYSVSARVSGDLEITYIVNIQTSSVSSDVTASYGIREAVYSDLAAAYAVRAIVSASLFVSYAIGVVPPLHVAPPSRTFKFQPVSNVRQDNWN